MTVSNVDSRATRYADAVYDFVTQANGAGDPNPDAVLRAYEFLTADGGPEGLATVESFTSDVIAGKVGGNHPENVRAVALNMAAEFLAGTKSKLAALLDDVVDFIGSYVVFPIEGARDAVALWCAHTHALDAFESTPRLALLSVMKQSGKTRALEVCELVVPNPMNVVNTTSAALFRQVGANRPTLLMDEADTYLGPQAAKQHEELRGFVNAGHRRSAKAWRCVGEPAHMRVEAFPAFCALAIAGIGDLPDTVIDRAVVIRMKRRGPGEKVKPFRARYAQPEGNALRDRLSKWAKKARTALAHAEPELPEGITDRPADVWEALVAIADMAGGDWPERARRACVKINSDRQVADMNSKIRLLADIRDVFDAQPAESTLEGPQPCERLRSETLVGALVAIEDAPWSQLSRGPLSAAGLARRLRPFDIGPAKIRFEQKTLQGYLRAQFEDAWARYLPASPVEAEQPEQEEQEPAPPTSTVPAVPAVPSGSRQADE